MAEFIDQLHESVRKRVLLAIQEFFAQIPEWTKEKILEKINELQPGKKLASSPLIKVAAVDEEKVTILIRGRMSFKLKNIPFAPFVRIVVELSRTEIEAGVPTFLGEFAIVTKDKSSMPFVEVRLGFGIENGTTFVGRGTLKLKPVGFGLDVFLGGLSSHGLMIGIDLYLPVPIPLGPTGLGFFGIGGDYAYGFKPRLEAGLEAEGPPRDLETGEMPGPIPPAEIEDPTAMHYILWARNPDDALDRWVEAPVNETAIGFGVRAAFCDMASRGDVLRLDPLGFALLFPGPVVILGGEGFLLGDSCSISAYIALDLISKSLGFGSYCKYEPPRDDLHMLEAKGSFEMFFSFSEPKTWFIHIGSREKPIEAKFFIGLIKEIKLYLEIDHHKIAFGLRAAIGWGFDFKIIAIEGRIGGQVAALIGWNPRQLAGEFILFGELSIKIFFIKFGLEGKGGFIGHVPEPKFGKVVFELKLNLPWPIPDIKFEHDPKVIDEDNVAPRVSAPLPEADNSDLHIGAVHPLSGRQFDFDVTDPEIARPWPDIEIVVPFSRRAIDATGKILGPAISPEVDGGYYISHTLTELTLFDLVNEQEITDFRAAWAEAPDGETAQLHVLGADPYSWLLAHEEQWSSVELPPDKVVAQHFGPGEEETFSGERRFGDVILTPAEAADSLTLSNLFAPYVSNRTVSGLSLHIVFQSLNAQPIPVDRIELVFIESQYVTTVPIVAANVPLSTSIEAMGAINESLWFRRVVIEPLEPLTLSELTVTAGVVVGGTTSESLSYLYAVIYREARGPVVSWSEKQLLAPGRYRLTVRGTTETAAVQEGLAEPEPIPWSLEREFEVVIPRSLRPYTKYTTIGDTRLIRNEPSLWNPTLYGIGFPFYRLYRPVIRFLVPYISTIFPSLILRIEPEDSSQDAVEQELALQPNPDDESSALPFSKDFAEWHGGAIKPDEEIAGDTVALSSGPARVRLQFEHPAMGRVDLDDWTCFVSQFNHFAHHLAINKPRLVTVYTPDGPVKPHSCPKPGTGGTIGDLTLDGSGMDGGGIPLVGGLAAPLSPVPLPDFPEGIPKPFPDELDEPPITWRLPAKLAKHVVFAGMPSEFAFPRFAQDSGVLFFDNSNPLYGIGNTAGSTRIEALEDHTGRFLALWIRTPEPLDWRRVSGMLRIRHVIQTGQCPKDYAYRKPLLLTLHFLPNLDASSAFAVGSFAGILTRLPRGEYELTLSFDPEADDTYPLRPGILVNQTPEVVMHRFVQPRGLDWPLPTEEIGVPAATLESLVRRGPGGLEPDVPGEEAVADTFAGVATFGALDPAQVVLRRRRKRRRPPRPAKGSY
ncbi:MAG TPA: hypothetical protein VGK64_14955 [Bryobacteraceae bacterium]